MCSCLSVFWFIGCLSGCLSFIQVCCVFRCWMFMFLSTSTVSRCIVFNPMFVECLDVTMLSSFNLSPLCYLFFGVYNCIYFGFPSTWEHFQHNLQKKNFTVTQPLPFFQ